VTDPDDDPGYEDDRPEPHDDHGPASAVDRLDPTPWHTPVPVDLDRP
jgi:hypothetical protein